MTVEILNDQSRLKLSAARVRRLVRFVLSKEKAGPRSVTVRVVDDPKIRQLNRRYLGEDRPTDVIAFGAGGTLETEKNYLGDVVVSAQTAVRACRRYGATPRGEFERYVVHGVLHLLGYRDKKPKDFKRMHERQERYLTEFGKRA